MSLGARGSRGWKRAGRGRRAIRFHYQGRSEFQRVGNVAPAMVAGVAGWLVAWLEPVHGRIPLGE